MKRIITLLVAVAMALSVGVIATSALTATEEYSEKVVNQPETGTRWVNTNSINLGISYSGTTISCSGTIRGNANVNSITAVFTLSRQNSNGTFTTVKTWSRSSDSRTLNFSETYSPVSKGQTYRLSVSATVTAIGGVNEGVSDSIVKTY